MLKKFAKFAVSGLAHWHWHLSCTANMKQIDRKGKKELSLLEHKIGLPLAWPWLCVYNPGQGGSCKCFTRPAIQVVAAWPAVTRLLLSAVLDLHVEEGRAVSKSPHYSH